MKISIDKRLLASGIIFCCVTFITLIQTRGINLAQTPVSIDPCENYYPLFYAIFSPDAHFALATHRHSPIELWNVQTGQIQATLQTDDESIAFSPDGNSIATSSGTSTTIWDAHTAQKRFTFTFDGGGVTTPIFTPDSQKLFNLNAAGAYIWDVQLGMQLAVLSSETPIDRTIASPDGKYAMTSDIVKGKELWDVELKRKIHTFLDATDAEFTPDSKSIVINGKDGLSFWQIDPLKQLQNLDPKQVRRDIQIISPDSQYFVTISYYDKTPNIILWDADKGKQVYEFSSGEFPVLFLPNGDLLIYYTDSRQQSGIGYWNIKEKRLLPQQQLNDLTAVFDISKDGKYLLGMASDKKLTVVERESGNRVLTTCS